LRSGKEDKDEAAGGDAEVEGEIKSPVLNYARPRKRQRMSVRNAIWWIAILIGAMVVLTILLALLFPPKRYFW